MGTPVGGPGSGRAPGAPAVTLRPVQVAQSLQDGEKFIKWDEVSALDHSTCCNVSAGPDQ